MGFSEPLQERIPNTADEAAYSVCLFVMLDDVSQRKARLLKERDHLVLMRSKTINTVYIIIIMGPIDDECPSRSQRVIPGL